MTERKDRREHTANTVMEELLACELKVGEKIEEIKTELDENKQALKLVTDDWEKFIQDFNEMREIFMSAKYFFSGLGLLGRILRWTALTGLAIGSLWLFLRTGHWK